MRDRRIQAVIATGVLRSTSDLDPVSSSSPCMYFVDRTVFSTARCPIRVRKGILLRDSESARVF